MLVTRKRYGNSRDHLSIAAQCYTMLAGIHVAVLSGHSMLVAEYVKVPWNSRSPLWSSLPCFNPNCSVTQPSLTSETSVHNGSQPSNYGKHYNVKHSGVLPEMAPQRATKLFVQSPFLEEGAGLCANSNTYRWDFPPGSFGTDIMRDSCFKHFFSWNGNHPAVSSQTIPKFEVSSQLQSQPPYLLSPGLAEQLLSTKTHAEKALCILNKSRES